MKTHLRPSLAALFAMLLFLAACGDTTTDTEGSQAGSEGSESTDDTASSDGEMSEMEHGGHDHGSAIDVPAGMAVPDITVSAVADTVSGHNVFIELSDFTITPENASTDPVDGEGHLHLYVDGERQMRFYNQAIVLQGLEPGDHEVMVEVSANNHSAYAVDGAPIRAMTTITVPESDPSVSSGHGHDSELFASANPPSIELTVTKDPKSGWNLHADVANMVFAPESAGLDPVDGEGHLHLSIDGVKVTRLYGSWWHIPALAAGSHEIEVSAATNAHVGYADANGDAVSATFTLEVDEADGSDMASDMSDGDTADGEMADGTDDGHAHGHAGTGELLSIAAADADVVVSASFFDGDLNVEDRRVKVETGSTVGLTFESDTVEQLHVHGYDLLIDVGPSKTADIAFLADSPGTFEVELESSGRFLFEIQVS
ncbi:MAG: hypothetical protein ACRBK7_00465 [Acidimicrobiales bacterium]